MMLRLIITLVIIMGVGELSERLKEIHKTLIIIEHQGSHK